MHTPSTRVCEYSPNRRQPRFVLTDRAVGRVNNWPTTDLDNRSVLL